MLQRLAKMTFVVSLAAAGVGAESASAGIPAIDAALAAHYKFDAAASYQYALVDLNGDGVLDAVVLLTDPAYCGSGGCNMAILRGTADSFIFQSGSSVSSVPIRVLAEARHGWKSLAVQVGGGGAEPGTALMRFDGQRYPSNPTTQPRAGKADLTGSVQLELQR